MKKIGLAILVTILFTFTGCHTTKVEVFKVGATPPSIDILNNLKPDFEKVGLKVQIVEFSDYNSPNIALANKFIDANFFQHKPFLDYFKKKHHLKITSAGGVTISPIGLYSNKLKNINEIKDGMTIGLPDDPTNLTRALLVLEDSKLIQLNHSEKTQLTVEDVLENELHLRFYLKTASELPQLLNKVDATFINGNYAVSNGIDIMKDSIYVEKKDSPYVDIVAVRDGDENSDKVKKFMKVLKSDKTKDYIKNHFDSIFPVY